MFDFVVEWVSSFQRIVPWDRRLLALKKKLDVQQCVCSDITSKVTPAGNSTVSWFLSITELCGHSLSLNSVLGRWHLKLYGPFDS